MKEIKDYLYKNSIYIWKEARKSIADSLLGTIYKLTPLKWPTDNSADKPTDDSASNPTDDSADDPINDFANDPTNNFTLALLLLLTTPI